jgi:hypothetical protein
VVTKTLNTIPSSQNIEIASSKGARLSNHMASHANKGKLNSVALVRKRTIPTERPPLVGEVSANFCG